MKPAIVAAVGALAVAIAIGINLMQSNEADVVSTAPSAPAPSPAPPASVERPAAERAGALPSFDVVRINPRGDTVIAGRSEPGAEVVLRDGEQVLGRVTADPRGEWVFVPETPLPPGSHRLELEMRTTDGRSIASTEEVLVIVPTPGRDVAGGPADEAAQPLALRMPRGGGPATVMQTPNAGAGEDALAIESLDYDAQGNLVVSGRAPPSSRLRLLLDGRAVGEAEADGEGRWRIAPKRPAKGDIRTLAVEQLDRAGKPLARTAVPFTGATAAAVTPGERQVVVQRGGNLWRIARSVYGQGTSYTVIFEANRGLIRDPDLIYPGQVFQLPGGAGQAARN